MRVAFVATAFPRLSATFVIAQAAGLVARGHDVDIFCDREGDRDLVHEDVGRFGLLERTFAPRMPEGYGMRLLKSPGVLARTFLRRPAVALGSLNVFRYGALARSLVLLYGAVPLLGTRPPYDVVHAHFGPNGKKALFFRRTGLLEGPLVTTFYGYDLSRSLQRDARLYDDLLREGDAFLAVSEVFAERLRGLGGDPRRVRVHRLGVDCQKFRPPVARPEGPWRLLSVGRLVEKKGFEFAVRALARLRDSGVSAAYTILGEGPLWHRLERLVASLGLEGMVSFVGARPHGEIPAWLARSHVLVAPSVIAKDGDEEGTPTVILEAMAMGLPIVATRHGGIPETVDHGVTGLLVAERDPEGLCSALAEVHGQEDGGHAMGLEGRRRAQSSFDVERLNDQLVDLYQGLL